MPSTYANGWHPGELAAQRAMGFDGPVGGNFEVIEDRLPPQHRAFHSELAYIAITTLDDQGRPWGSLLTARNGQPGFIQSPDSRLLKISADVWEGDPVAENAGYNESEPGLTAGLGIMFNNRRRNKFAGKIAQWKRHEATLEFDVQIDEAVG